MRLDHDGGRRRYNGDCGPGRYSCASGWPGNDRTDWGLAGDGAVCRHGNDRWCRPRGGRHDLARSRRSGSRSSRCCDRSGSGGSDRFCRDLGSGRRRCTHRGPVRFCFFFLLFGQDRLQDITWLGHMREINFWGDRLRATRGGTRAMSTCARRPVIEMHTDFLRLMLFKRA